MTYLGVALVVVVGLFVYSAIVMFLWNLVIPTIFPTVAYIDVIQAFGLIILGHLLTGAGSASSKK